MGELLAGASIKTPHLHIAEMLALSPLDPNGLVFADGTWRLFVQNCAAGPDFREIGWARLSSPDLLHRTWDGPVIAPDALGQAYSGSVVVREDCLTAYLTRHDGECQRQVGLTMR